MKVWSLGSGSSGNAVVVECDGSRILIDVGFGPRILARRMRSVGIEPESIEACIVTHDHSDHVKGAAQAARRWKWSMHATAGTASCAAMAEVEPIVFAPGETLSFSRCEVTTVATPHDATDPVGLTVTASSTGARLGLCYDVGAPSAEVRSLCEDVDILMLEANHDVEMLRVGPYPYWLKKRISGGLGHLSNSQAGELLASTNSRRLGAVVLAHLSQHNNSPSVALQTVGGFARRARFRGTVAAALQDIVTGPFLAGGVRARSADPMQMALAL
jgi:phosphoribosyl 1,2-cyclic phosphodiesterase